METPKVPEAPKPQSPNPVPTENPRVAQRQAQVNAITTPHATPLPSARPLQPEPPVVERREVVTLQDLNAPLDPNLPPVPPAVPIPGAPTPMPADMHAPARPATATLTTAHQLVATLDEAAANIVRYPQGQEVLLHDIQEMRAKIIAPGFNPSPDDMQHVHDRVYVLSEKARLLAYTAATPGLVTLELIEELVERSITTANRLRSGREDSLRDIQGVRNRLNAIVRPPHQLDLNTIHTTIMAILTRLETHAGQQGV